MGAGNVKVVYALWADLPHVAFRVLAFMALVTQDREDPPRFWAGRETLALAAGRLVPDGDVDEQARKARRAAFAAVDRALADLTAAGALVLEARAHTGRHAIYQLRLTAPRTPWTTTPRKHHAQRGPLPAESTTPSVDHPGVESTTLTVKEDHAHRDKRTTLTVKEDHAHRGPEEEEEEPRNIRRKEVAALNTTVTQPRATRPHQDPPVDSPAERAGADPPPTPLRLVDAPTPEPTRGYHRNTA